jgi:hypothetical protein
MIDLKEIIFAPLNLSILPEEIEQIKKEHQQEELKSFYSKYRTCRMIPLMTSLGATDPETIANKNQAHQWTENIDKMPITKRILTDKFLPLVGSDCRIITLCTPAHSSVKVHYDCTEDSFHEVQLKMRLVLTSHLNSLWFLGPDNERVFSKSRSPSYVINGAHPHGAINDTDQEKMTICLGGNFQGNNESFLSSLKKSLLDQRGEWITHKEVPKRFIPELFQSRYEAILSEGQVDDRFGLDL